MNDELAARFEQLEQRIEALREAMRISDRADEDEVSRLETRIANLESRLSFANIP